MKIGPGLPAYQHIYIILKDNIRKGIYSSGTKLPSEANLRMEYQVSRVTVRKALDMLVKDGLVEKEQGRGTIVKSQKDRLKNKSEIRGLISNIIAAGTKLNVETLAWNHVEVGSDVATALGLRLGDSCSMIKRLRRHKDLPIALTSIFLPDHISRVLMKDPVDDTTLVLDQLIKAGFEPQFTTHKLSATLATGEAMQHFSLSIGTPLLQMKGTVYDETNLPIYYQESIYHPEHYEYAVRLDRDEGTDQLARRFLG